ncbi:MAG: hypothetical protein LBS90_01055 [Oscillospiraceae bacterium]|jgi:hypothetical protein|nr:hypothetical protein [Oscillospiraceae bacterium]
MSKITDAFDEVRLTPESRERILRRLNRRPAEARRRSRLIPALTAAAVIIVLLPAIFALFIGGHKAGSADMSAPQDTQDGVYGAGKADQTESVDGGPEAAEEDVGVPPYVLAPNPNPQDSSGVESADAPDYSGEPTGMGGAVNTDISRDGFRKLAQLGANAYVFAEVESVEYGSDGRQTVEFSLLHIIYPERTWVSESFTLDVSVAVRSFAPNAVFMLPLKVTRDSVELVGAEFVAFEIADDDTVYTAEDSELFGGWYGKSGVELEDAVLEFTEG